MTAIRKFFLAAAGLGMLAACGIGERLGFSANNLQSAKPACVLNTTTQRQELNLRFDYTGTLSRLSLTFTPNGKPAVTVNIPNLDNPPAGFRLDTRTATVARVYVDLGLIEPSANAQAIPQPNPRTLFPMDVSLKAGDGSTERTLDLTNVDVAACYGL